MAAVKVLNGALGRSFYLAFLDLFVVVVVVV